MLGFLQGDRPKRLVPFVLQLPSTFIVGMMMEGNEGSPCAQCLVLWLKEKGIEAQEIPFTQLPIRQDLMGELYAIRSGHVFYEVQIDGIATKLDCVVMRHPYCQCKADSYEMPRDFDCTKDFTFTPITQIKAARFGTPAGDLWMTSVSGKNLNTGQLVTALATSDSKASSREKAIFQWMKRYQHQEWSETVHPMPAMIQTQIFQHENPYLMPTSEFLEYEKIIGSGRNRDAALLDGLQTLATKKTVLRFTHSGKSPMLVVGINQWLQQHVPFFLLQEYDIHLLFYPTSMPVWVVGLVALSRKSSQVLPLFAYHSHVNAHYAIKEVIGTLLIEHSRRGQVEDSEKKTKFNSVPKLNTWWTQWVYRCPKIALKDVLHLEPYKPKVEAWIDFLKDGEDPLPVLNGVPYGIPKELFSIVGFCVRLSQVVKAKNVIGIGGSSSHLHLV